MMCDALQGLSPRYGLCWFYCRLSRRLELWQVQTKFILHTSKGCSSQTVAAHMVFGHGGEILHLTFGNGLRASGTTKEKTELGQNALHDNKEKK